MSLETIAHRFWLESLKYKVNEDNINNIFPKLLKDPENPLLKTSIQSTKLYTFDKSFNLDQYPDNEGYTIDVKQQDCLEIADQLATEGHRTLLLNMTTNGAVSGPGSEEEWLYHMTSLYPSVVDIFNLNGRKNRFPLGEFSALYTPYVFRIRDEDYYIYNDNAIKDSAKFSVVTCAAPVFPGVAALDGFLENMYRPYADILSKKIDTIFQIALLNGCECVVLSAWGCGKAQNHPKWVARTFKERLEVYKKKFHTIQFGILNKEDYCYDVSDKYDSCDDTIDHYGIFAKELAVLLK